MSTPAELVNPRTFEQPLCAEVSPSFFFLDDLDDNTIDEATANTSYKVAVTICSSCEHISDCAEWGIRKEIWGVWGGLTPPQRRAIRRTRNITVRE